MGKEQQPTKEKALLQALVTILKPLVRLLIDQNITYTSLQNILKQTYVKVADSYFRLEGKRQTDSRISLLTGVHRADVKRIRTEATAQISDKEIKASLSAQIMSIWTGHHTFIDSKGHPKALCRYMQDGSPSFEELVLSVSKDKHPRSFIDDWKHQGIIDVVAVEGKERVLLTEKGYIPEADFEEKLFFTGKNIGDHLSVVVNNLEGNTPSMFDRAVFYQQLTESSVKELEALSEQLMMEALVEINRRASQLQERDQSKENANRGMHVGAYFYHEGTEKNNDRAK